MSTRKNPMIETALASVLAVSAASVFAAPQMPGFKEADKNNDGAVSLAEFESQGGYEQAFYEGDDNRDKRLNNGEYVKAVANHDRLKTSKFVDDAWITAKIKALLLKDEQVKGLDVNVETHEGTVQLSGWVGSSRQIARAEQIARGIDGVKGVHNDLQLKR